MTLKKEDWKIYACFREFFGKEKAEKLFRQAHTWYTKGVSNSVCMDLDIWNLWCKIIDFCSMV